MKSTSVILFVISTLLLLGLYIYVDDRFTKMEARLQGSESALNTLEPLRSLLAAQRPGPSVEDPYGAVQALGAPNATAEGRDSAFAWCPATENGGEEWLLLDYEGGVEAVAVRVVANFNPGALARLEAVAPDGARVELWSGVPGAEGAAFTQEIPLAASQSIGRLRVVLDTAAVDGWNEIDAVGLIDGTGAVSWATGAEASSAWESEAVAEPAQGP